MPNNGKPGIQSWIKKITDNEMPIFGHTVQEVISVSQDGETSAAQLSKVVLKDAVMTSRILKLANSVYYKRSEQKINTISRAIMLLGFDTVRSMCLTVALIDGLEQGNNRKHLVQEMARSLHAATQARIIAIERKDESAEEIYISTLLYHVGDLAFWCFCNEEEGERMDEALRQIDITPEKAQRETLGFSLNELSVGLAKAWSLSDLLQSILEHPNSKDERARSVVLAQQLAIASEKGWESKKVLRLTREMTKLTGSDIESVTEKIHEGARQAAQDSMDYGARLVSKEIPLPSVPEESLSKKEAVIAHDYPEPDSGLQLAILRELTRLTAQETNINIVMEKILEGLHGGVGMDRALFALMTPERKSLLVKCVVGDEGDSLKNSFSFKLSSRSAEILNACMQEQQPLWLHENSAVELTNKVSEAFVDITGTAIFVVAPIVVKARVIGIYYADRRLSGRVLDEDSFENFQFFTQQSNLILNHLASKS